jgi:SAM-dependent methyltransferase
MMSYESLMVAVHELSASMDALAAVGAELRRRRESLSVPPPIHELLQGVLSRIDPDLLTDLAPNQEATALGIIESFFRQSADLLQRPARTSGWTYNDPAIINGQGMTSCAFVRTFEAAASKVPDFQAVLARPGTLLDVGTGAAWLAIEVARSWPRWKVVGIDRWKPALDLAALNVAATGMQDRIELRCQDIQELSDENVFSLAWLPGPFLSADVVSHALARVRKALLPDGWLAFSLFAPEQARWGEALTTLKVVRNGGHPWKKDELEAKLRRHGFEQVSSLSTTGSTVTIGRRGI